VKFSIGQMANVNIEARPEPIRKAVQWGRDQADRLVERAKGSEALTKLVADVGILAEAIRKIRNG
jgi:hypothetical protein